METILNAFNPRFDKNVQAEESELAKERKRNTLLANTLQEMLSADVAKDIASAIHPHRRKKSK